MSELRTLLPEALHQLLGILTHGPQDGEFFILDDPNAGLIPTLQAIDAEHASRPPFPGGHTLAGHVQHLTFTFGVFNRWAQGEENPFATADWASSWGSQAVDPAQWQSVVQDFEREAAAWRQAVREPRDLDDVTLPGAITSVAHLAYHLGAIRQIVARDVTPPPTS
ncbi:MAG: DinB family protein [Planctomycetota bacterium]